jgi:hypothetical protein
MDADSSLDHVFFPDSGVVSVVAVYGTAASLRWQQSVGSPSRRRQRTLVSNFVQTPVGQRAHSFPNQTTTQGDSAPKPVGANEGYHA